ncbi:hypothetical protein [Aureivirga sp. CE67]|uniref:hypothetical protein n=1 Tax=Aureivirga sp. CE67 TaxID=1788983 RepID=UPI0018CB8CAF|nr:hypothetical protein [Aureivirga sp. CE67]
MKKLLVIIFACSLGSCLSLEEKKEKAEKEGNSIVSIKSKLIKGAGDALKSDGKEAAESASEGLGEVIKGTSSGFDKSLARVNVKSDSTFSKVFEIGRTAMNVEKDTSKIVVYLIANKDFNGKVKLKAFDNMEKEMGRKTMPVNMKEDDAEYFDFIFDKRTPLSQVEYYEIELK